MFWNSEYPIWCKNLKDNNKYYQQTLQMIFPYLASFSWVLLGVM